METEQPDELLTKMVQWFEDSADSTRDSRELSERDRDYYDGKQLTDKEIGTLKQRGQPPVIINRIKPKVDFLLGMERQVRTDPKAAPRTPQDEESATAATDAIRYVCDDQNFSETRSNVYENEIVEGTGGAIVEIEENLDIKIKRIPWDRIYYDPHASERNFSDARYKGIVVWLDLEAAKVMYPNAAEMLSDYTSHPDRYDTYADKPKHQWYDSKRKRVRICECYYMEGAEWYYCVYTKAGFLVEPAPSKYKDEDDVPTCPIEYISSHVDRDNNRYGIVRQLIGPQDEVNKRRSKALHLISMRQTMGERGAVDDIKKMKAQLAKPDGHVEVTPGMNWQILPTTDMATGNLNLLQEAKNEIDQGGANAALTGKTDANESGRALQARQQSGMTELGPIMDALRMWQRAIYRQVWNRVKQYWTAEKWVRITDDENNIKFVGLNQPVTMGEQMVEQAKQQGMPPEQLQMLVQQLGQDPQAQQVVGTKNNVSEMDVDIILEDVPDTVNIQAEQFELLTQMYQANPQGVPFKAVISASNLRNKTAILDELKQAAEGQQKQAEEAKQVQMADAQAKTEKTQSETALNASKIQSAQLDDMLKRMEAVVVAMDGHIKAANPFPQKQENRLPQ